MVVQMAKPLNFDLVRRANSNKGEKMSSFKNFLFLFGFGIFVIGGCTSASGPDINPGYMHGNIYFTETSAFVNTHLSENPVVAFADDTYFPVRVYEAESFGLSTTGNYSPVNDTQDDTTYIAASYEAHPHISGDNNDFFVIVDSIVFEDGAKYRFGSLDTNSSDTLCQDVVLLEDSPEGTLCDISECAALVNIPYRFVGEQENLEALDENYPVECIIIAHIEEPPGSGTTGIQAQSSILTSTVGEMIDNGTSTQLLIRSCPSPISFEISCDAQVEEGEIGFEILPDTGLTPFSWDFVQPPLACGETVTIPEIEIPVIRNSGRLEGYFDVSGYDEVNARILVDHPSAFQLTPILVPAGEEPNEKWVFEGIPAGWHTVSAKAILNDGEQVLTIPDRDGQNDQVFIEPFETTDINATFVAEPVLARGNIRILDPGGEAGIPNIQSIPFNSSFGSSGGRSYITARGNWDLPANISNPGSGIGGYSKARLNFTSNPTINHADMNYELFFTGISPENGALDGSDAKPTLWDILYLVLKIEHDTDINSGAPIDLAEDLHYLADINAGDITIPQLSVCLGKIRLTLQIDENIGTIYKPIYTIYSEGSYMPTVNGVSPLSAVSGGWASGIPKEFEDRGPIARSFATLPEGFRYEIAPEIRFSPGNNSDISNISMLTLDTIYLPEEGVLNCGSIVDSCMTMTDIDGSFSGLSLDINGGSAQDVNEYCLHNNNLDLIVNVNSDGGSVDKLAYVLDPPEDTLDEAKEYCLTSTTATELCTICGPDPEHSVTISALPPGPHTLWVCASDAFGCTAASNYSFNVEEQDLAIECGDNFTVELNPGEFEISKDDPRFEGLLYGDLVGNCGIVDTVYNDSPEIFTEGEWEITFTSNATDTPCITTVTITKPRMLNLTFVDQVNSNDHVLKVYTVETATFESYMTFPAVQPYEVWVEYDKTGDKLGYAHTGLNTIVTMNAETGGNQTLYNTSDAPVSFAFRPNYPHHIAVIKTNDFQTYKIELVEGTNLLDTLDVPQIPNMSRILDIAWSPAGDKLAAVFTAINQTNPSNGIIYYYEWALSGNSFGTETLTTVERDFDEVPHELIHREDDSGLFATTYTVSGKSGASINSIFDLISQDPRETIFFDDIDLTEDGTSAAILSVRRYSTETEVLSIGCVLVLNDLDQGEPIEIVPPYPFKLVLNGRQVAISSDKRYIAVGKTDGIDIYNYPDYTLLTQINANNPYGIVFRPINPLP